jgi:hypothetical protein
MSNCVQEIIKAPSLHVAIIIGSIGKKNVAHKFLIGRHKHKNHGEW